MKIELVVALISFSGVLLSIIIAVIFNVLTSKYNYNKLFAETVSKNRMDWINVWRENVAIFLATAKVLYGFETRAGEKYDNYVFQQQKAKAMLTTRLNLTEDMHIQFLRAIEEVDCLESNETVFLAKCEIVEELARAILKPEWERVKREAKGKEK